jgi:NAD(P)-dependent dehydrogenase (short-subunit alcohol dehydrogenase family)
MIDFKDKLVLVTGAASGIGAALATALAKRGAQLVCADRDSAGVARMADQIGGGARALECDLADPAAAAKLIDDVYDMAGRLDLVCSNAGIGYRGKLAKQDFDDEAVSRLFEINFLAALRIARAYAEHLQQSGAHGRLMVTASENSLSVPSAVRTRRMALYGASKHALLVAMEWMRIEQAQAGDMDLHVLMPGAVYTPLIAAGLPDPTQAPPELELIMPDQCAEIALRGMDLGLFYIPTQAHLLEDMQPRLQEVESALKALGIGKAF